MNSMTVRLYRRDGAQGVATHWAPHTGACAREGYELLGLGEIVATPSRWAMWSQSVRCADDIIDNKIAAHSDVDRHITAADQSA